MKRQFVFFSLTTFTISVVACKKDKQFKPEEVRLVGADVYSDNGVQHEIIDYNADGKITKISFQFNNDAPKTRFGVSYSGNEIIIVEPPVINNATELRDTVRLQLNPNGTISKRIHSSFFEVKPPTAEAQRTYVKDTTLYQYDIEGLLARKTLSKQDSTWTTNPAVPPTSVIFTNEMTDYTVVNRNVTAANTTRNTLIVSRTPTRVFTSSNSGTTNSIFEYSKAYPNKTDFSNAAILDEMDLFTLRPMYKEYSLLPTKLTESYTDKDQNGAVISSGTYSTDYIFEYNFFGLVSSVRNSTDPNWKITYRYTY